MIKFNNINKPTSAKWGKVMSLCALASSTITAAGLSQDNHAMVWVGAILTFIGGAIPILTNGVTKSDLDGTNK